MPSAFWRRIYKAFNYGDVLITLGTGRLSTFEEEGLGLASQHDYAIIDMREDEGRRLFLIKNPWSEGGIWKGHLDPGYETHERDVGMDGSNSRHGLEPLMPGTFWMDLNNVFQHFESIYLNWNPGLFTHRQDVHFKWNLSTTKSPIGSFVNNPQYRVLSVGGGTVWILLSRHFKSISQDGTSTGPRVDLGFISLYAFNKGGQRVFLSDAALVRSPYVDAPNTLLRLELPSNLAYTIVVSEQELPLSIYNFTLSAFSLKPLSITHATEKYSHSTISHGAWTFSTSGGNASSPDYHTNPQYSISLSVTSDAALLLASDTADFPVHVKLVWAKGKRATQISKRDIVGDSGEYRKGSALAEIRDIQAGTYTVICSTFQQGQRGKFSLRVYTTAESRIKPIPLEEAGRLVLKLPRASFSPDIDRLLAPLQVVRITQLRLIAHRGALSKAATGSPIRIALEYGQGPNKEVFAISGDGEYMDTHTGLRTRDVDVLPSMCQDGGVWLVVERLGASGVLAEEGVEVELLSDNPVECGAWGVGDG